eukprot:3078226-Rhodomonas_salina.1
MAIASTVQECCGKRLRCYGLCCCAKRRWVLCEEAAWCYAKRRMRRGVCEEAYARRRMRRGICEEARGTYQEHAPRGDDNRRQEEQPQPEALHWDA